MSVATIKLISLSDHIVCSCIVNFLQCVIYLKSCDILLKSEHLADGTKTMNKFVRRKQLDVSETNSLLGCDPC